MKEQVFVNRLLNMKKIKYVGFDMDHTLIRYHTQNFEALVYQLAVNELITSKKYPSIIKQLKFDFQEAIRGLVIDSKNGNVLKLNRFGAIRTSCHGTRPIDFTEQKQFYRSVYVDLGDPNYIAIDTSFSIAFCVLFSQLVDLKDLHPNDFPTYPVIAQDVLAAVDVVHANNSLKSTIAEHLDEYVIRDPQVVEGLQRYLRHGKKLFILTNSDYNYTKLLMDYAVNPFIKGNIKWQQLFEYIITSTQKPRFFYDNLNFLTIDGKTGAMSNAYGPITPGIYQGGNAKKFTNDLALVGDEILYIGDHIYGDILRLKKDCNWRTALVVEELGREIQAQLLAYPIEKKIVAAMEVKSQLEQDYMNKVSHNSEEKNALINHEIHELQHQLATIDNELTELIKQQICFYNKKWERIFRAGAEESYFAYQVERYACVYMEKLSSLFTYSPLNYFRARRRLLAHDEAGR